MVHAGLWFALHSVLVMVLGRPWFALAIGLALITLIVQVSNAKFHALREPFVFQDFEYFTDAIRHPRLYIPFLGWWKFALISLAVAAALFIGLILEDASPDRFRLTGQLGAVLALSALAGFLIFLSRGGCAPSFDPQEDLDKHGLMGSLWFYRRWESRPLVLPEGLLGTLPIAQVLPDIVAIQSESFFDPRLLFPDIRPETLCTFDLMKSEALHHGPLKVPAWGANTVRSEFAFLSGARAELLGVHRFNPYRGLLSARVLTLASTLRAAGYRTVCIHPYPASFYNRARIYPHLGFDEFIDIRAFAGAKRFGPYVADTELALRVKDILGASKKPLFVFVITMENHGPLHLESPGSDDADKFYTVAPPSGCEDLTVYLRHLCNADHMMADLRATLKAHPRPARLCWYGDHVPIMTKVYDCLAYPEGLTEYFVWSNESMRGCKPQIIPLDRLPGMLLRTIV